MQTPPRSRREFLKAGATIVSAAVTGSAQSSERPNILLILSDDHSAPHVGCYGNSDIRTPNLDRLAGEGMRFDSAYVTCPQCVPSRASIMTGRSPVAINMTRFTAPLPMDVRTYPELLRAQGYFTGVAGRSYHLDGNGPDVTQAVLEKYGLRTFRKRLDFVKTGSGGATSVQQFTEFLDQSPKGRPFFLQLCFNDPHRPLDRNAIPQPHDGRKLKLPAHYPDTQLVREDFARYYDEISRFDSDMGRVLSLLEQRGLAKNTLVAMMGDNGASQWRGKGTLYEFGIHVPLIVRWPGRVRPGSSSTDLISGEDIAPTFLEAAGIAPPPEITGRSFVKLLRGERYEARSHIFAARGPHGNSLPNGSAAFDLGRTIRTRRHKLIYNATWQIPYEPVDFRNEAMWKEAQQMARDGKLPPPLAAVYSGQPRAMFELYDLEKDPAELRNIAGRPETAELEHELKATMQEWMILQRDYVPLPLPGRDGAASRPRRR